MFFVVCSIEKMVTPLAWVLSRASGVLGSHAAVWSPQYFSSGLVSPSGATGVALSKVKKREASLFREILELKNIIVCEAGTFSIHSVKCWVVSVFQVVLKGLCSCSSRMTHPIAVVASKHALLLRYINCEG